MKLSVSIPVSIPLLTAYDRLRAWTQSLPSHYLDWAPGHEAFMVLSGKSAVEKMPSFEFRERIGPLALVVCASVTEIEPPHRIAWKATSVKAMMLYVSLPAVVVSGAFLLSPTASTASILTQSLNIALAHPSALGDLFLWSFARLLIYPHLRREVCKLGSVLEAG